MDELTEEAVRDALRKVIDPELGGSIVDLGMVKKIEIDGGQVNVQLVLTAPGCPLADYIMMQMEWVLSGVPGVEGVEVTLLDEPWDPSGMSEDWQAWVNKALGRG